jgi:hypothetical protein
MKQVLNECSLAKVCLTIVEYLTPRLPGRRSRTVKIYALFYFCTFYYIHYPTSTRRHGNFAGIHTLLRILLSSNSAVLINIITGVSPPHYDFVVYYIIYCYYYHYKRVYHLIIFLIMS